MRALNGGRLLDAVENWAREKGCVGVRAETWDFQALGFYKKRGYKVWGKLRDHPRGHTDFSVCKRT